MHRRLTGLKARPARAGPGSVALGGGLGALLAGGMLRSVPAGVALGLLTATLFSLVRVELGQRRRHRDRAALVATLGLLARELRAGSPPHQALRAAASVTRGRGAQTVADLLAVVGVDGTGTTAAGSTQPGGMGPAAATMITLTAGWRLSARYGVPWAALVEAAAADLDQQLRAQGAAQAQLAGPRMSGYVLSVLPAFGLLLGVGMGADPLRVLTATPAGGALLVAGVSLTCAGLAWTARIIRQ